MADQNNVNQLLEAMKTSIVALNESMRNYNLRMMDSFKVFQNLDNTLKTVTDNLDINLKNVNADLQNFGERLQTLVLPDLAATDFNTNLKNSAESLKKFSQDLDSSMPKIKTFGSELQNLSQVVLSTSQTLKATAEQNQSEALKNFGKDLSDNVANLKDFGSEINSLSKAVAGTTKAFNDATSGLKSAESKSPSTVRTKAPVKGADKPPPIPKEGKNASADKASGGALAGILGRVNMAFTFVKKVVEIGVKSIALFNAALLASVVTMQMFTNRVKSYVQAYNPNLVKQFDYVLKDITAVIGKALQPVLVSLGAAFRQLGDILVPVMDALSPAFQSLAKAVSGFLLPIFNALGNALINAAPLINKLADEFAKVASELGNALGEMMPELIRYLADYLKNWVEQLKAYKNLAPLAQMWSKFNRAFLQAGTILLGYFNTFADYMKKIALKLRSWLDWFGITTKGKNYVGTNVEPAKTGNSTGMAAREAEYMNVEELSRGLIRAAYGSGQDIQRQQLEQQRMMNGQLAQINQKIGRAQVAPQPVQAGLRMA